LLSPAIPAKARPVKPLLIPLLFVPACAAGQASADSADYVAVGTGPSWIVTVRDDSIALDFGGGAHVYPQALRETDDGVRRWWSEAETAVISVEARPGPCTGPGEARYEDAVLVSLNGRQLHGCGGRLLGDEAGR
jgi:uncharacterized membrane protein